jgi:L,D-peptidoglycan transpeptidase YkuD (ErfK/YbiS/YcfS/YnhG family)
VFIHIARQAFGATAGCVALRRQDLRTLLARMTTKTRIKIHY